MKAEGRHKSREMFIKAKANPDNGGKYSGSGEQANTQTKQTEYGTHRNVTD